MDSSAKKLRDPIRETVDEFNEFPLFASFPEELKNELARASETLEFPANTQILQQGQTNFHLYFLVNGKVGVYVDGSRVSKLQRKGDLLGEMSVIASKTVGATILTETETTIIRVDSRVFMNMEGPDRDFYVSGLYRVYATVLAEKLHVTNQKAKHFEELTARLTAAQAELRDANENLEKKIEERTAKLEQQNHELTAGKNKMSEMIDGKRQLFQTLIDFQKKHLLPFKTLLDKWHKFNPDDLAIGDIRTNVFEIQQRLAPLTDLYSFEQAMVSKRVLLADSNKKQQITAKMALGGSGVELELASTLDEGHEKIAARDYDLIFLDTEMLDLGNVALAKNPGVGLVVMTSEAVPKYLPELKKLSRIPNIVSRDESDRTFSTKNIMTTATKLLSRDFFGLEKYLGWGVEIHNRAVVSSSQRENLLKEVDTYFGGLGLRSTNRDRIRLVLEELLMNAIYDAPVDDAGFSTYNHLNRQIDLKLRPEEQGLLRYATDGNLVAVSVQDPFGSLTGETILRYLERNYSEGDSNSKQEAGKGGAGRGLHQIIENSDLVVFNIYPGKKTEVVALFNVDAKAATVQNPSFHLFFKS